MLVGIWMSHAGPCSGCLEWRTGTWKYFGVPAEACWGLKLSDLEQLDHCLDNFINIDAPLATARSL
jgi:hypothetical protein